jgi:hypothetical protein
MTPAARNSLAERVIPTLLWAAFGAGEIAKARELADQHLDQVAATATEEKDVSRELPSGWSGDASCGRKPVMALCG